MISSLFTLLFSLFVDFHLFFCTDFTHFAPNFAFSLYIFSISLFIFPSHSFTVPLPLSPSASVCFLLFFSLLFSLFFVTHPNYRELPTMRMINDRIIWFYSKITRNSCVYFVFNDVYCSRNGFSCISLSIHFERKWANVVFFSLFKYHYYNCVESVIFILDVIQSLFIHLWFISSLLRMNYYLSMPWFAPKFRIIFSALF